MWSRISDIEELIILLKVYISVEKELRENEVLKLFVFVFQAMGILYFAFSQLYQL